MPVHVALLRGINVGGRKKVAMSDLRTLAAEIGLKDARTILQSGNLVFSSPKSPAALEALLEKALADRLGLTTQVLIRAAAAWAPIVSANPFPAEAAKDPSHLAVIFLKHKPAARAFAALKDGFAGPEYFAVRDSQIYAYFPDGFAGTKFTTALIDRRLETTATGRNWNTVLKLAAISSVR